MKSIKYRYIYSFLATTVLVACQEIKEPLLTFTGYTNYVETRFDTDALDCGESDYSDGITAQSNPEVTTCLHNAFANNQTAYGYYTKEYGSLNDTLWIGYSVTTGTVEHYSYDQDNDNPENESRMYGATCEQPSIPVVQGTSGFSQFDCEQQISLF